MSLHFDYPAAVAPSFENLSALDSTRPRYPVPYHNLGTASSAFAVGSSLGADHLEHLQCPTQYLHARGMQLGSQSAGHPRYGDTSSSPAPTRYATGVPISGWGATPAFSSRPVGHSWGRGAPASLEDTHEIPVHGHASAAASEALLPLRYSGPAAPSLSAPSPVISSSSSSTGSGSGVYKSGEGVVLAPIPQTLRPQMAILLSDRAAQESEQNSSDGAFTNLRMPVAYAMMYPDLIRETAEDDTAEEGFLSREKKHGCTMCHKRFDRPSTLKKHLLVHTGEKAFQCTICERRFGVMSNLNRHIRRCSLREVHTHGSAASTLPASPPEKTAPSTKRGRTAPPSSAAADSTDGASDPAPLPRKRRRRPPSPSRWIPASLRPFRILPPEVQAAAPVPLHPVSPGHARTIYDSDAGSDNGPQWDEERDSWDENVGSTPYHWREWEKTHRLPGPAIVRFGGAIGGNYNCDSDFPFGGMNRVRSRAIRV
ncbi:C2H2 conidiation transcriptional factor [Mycena sanguinolenta]|uniref:C2H2 conidiation transcriptional factor n=1 Tax=Mycena sanguinolenta TaxID=230812 RepID=A0A8H6YZM0_9AGAR|nr:C2H2 conidiation transcriptional factor [Mycena sanguinolenta]